ncbi:MAG: hypothetical protein Metus_0659 [Candidatus Methanosuratincola subterraneus]|uniref:Uncharacterized protein n=1 Tax=Methanosuratincola subterraneus TaxID=2593994 RepID=A0A444L8N0_METS7|nr:MAG: hypothetical protein Metus_0659 [Candidatus Methanosuratincola subterraneus]
MDSKKIFSLSIVAILMLPAIFVAFPLVAATITERPVVFEYMSNNTSDPLTVEARYNVSIWLGNMTITGGQVWLWLSKTGSADANMAAGDRWYAGPFYVGDIFNATAKDLDPMTPPAPFDMEGRNYTYTVGYGWINGTVPFMVQGGVTYWLKVTDVNPETTPSVPSSDVGVSTNRIIFDGAFYMTPNEGAPWTPVTVSGYALPADMTYNITQNGEFVANVSVETHNESGWLWTGFSYTFPIVDLKKKVLCEVMYEEEDPYETVTIEVIDETGATVDTFYFDEYFRQVWLDNETWQCGSIASEDSQYFLVPHGCIYYCEDNCTIVLYTGESYNITLKWFPYNGNANVYLNSTLLNSEEIQLNQSGGVADYTITIPMSLASGTYYFRVVDNNNVEYNFTVCVVQVPKIEFDPGQGGCGDQVTLKFSNMADFVGETITVLFDYTPALLDDENQDGIDDDFVVLANFTVQSANFEITVTVPHSAGGPRYVYIGDINGSPLVFGPNDDHIETEFTVTPKVWVDPASFNSDGSTFWVYGCGFLVSNEGPNDDWWYFSNYDLDAPYMSYNVKYWVAVDNQFVAVGGENGQVAANYTGDIAVQLVKAGFYPGKHVVSFYIKDRCDIYDYYNYTDYGIVAGNFPVYAYGTFTVSAAGDLILAELMDYMNSSFSSLNAKLVAIQDDIAIVQTNLGTMQTSINNLDAKVVALQGDMATVQTILGQINGTVTAINGNVATVKTDVGTIKADVSSVKGFLPVDMTPVWIAVVLALIAAIASIYAIVVIRSKIAA